MEKIFYIQDTGKFKIAEELLICLLSSGMDMEYIIKACNTGKLQSYVYSI